MTSTPTSPIAEAVAPLREAAIAEAEQAARAQIARAHELLAAADWNLDTVAPRPKSTMSKADYREADRRRGFFSSITAQDVERMDANGGRYMPSTPHYRKAWDYAEARFVEQAKEAAAAQYEAYVAKLEAKVGPVVEATLSGDRVWSYSMLAVVTAAGERQVWNTRRILNVSCLGKLFHQWPTRLVR